MQTSNTEEMVTIHYLLEQWPYLTRYLEDGRLELSSNRAECSIKPFVMDGQEELAVCQYVRWCAGQQLDLQPDGNGEGKRSGSVPLSAVGSAKRATTERN